MVHVDYSDKRNILSASQNWDSAIDFGTQSNTYALVRALLSEADRIDDELRDVYHSHHIDTATGEELEQYGLLVNAPRKSGEPDDKYRTRIKAEFAQSKTGTDFNSFVEFVTTVLGTSISNIQFITNYDAQPGVVTIRSDPSVFDNLSLTASEVVDILGGGVPAGHEVLVEERGTFRLKQDGDIDDPDKGLTSDGISTGGTLAADVL